VVVLALVAVALLLPESRSEQRPSVDVLGVALSSAGLVGLTYGFIRADEDGWTNTGALAAIALGAVILAVFVVWERRLTQRYQGQGRGVRPLIELALFRSAGFTWGTLLATLVSFAMFGIFFAMPQYFQEVQGANALGSGLRLLPMIGGMIVGMIGGTRLASPRKAADGLVRAPLADAKSLATTGFALMALALGAGATTKVASGTGFAAAWFACFGLGLGLAMPQTMNAALSALSAERSGSGSALISALRQVGATIGVAVLGTVLGSVYGSHLDVTGLPSAAAAAAKQSVVAGVHVAHELGSAALLDSVRTAFVQGLDVMLWICGGIALASAILALIFLPRRPDGLTGAPRAGAASPAAGQSGAERAQLEV
jgi:MFS transporter, DHA2 family, multidrug resistance protein